MRYAARFKYLGSKQPLVFQCPQCEKCLRNTFKEQLFKAENAAKIIAILEPWTNKGLRLFSCV
jgi:hypothetical protein